MLQSCTGTYGQPRCFRPLWICSLATLFILLLGSGCSYRSPQLSTADIQPGTFMNSSGQQLTQSELREQLQGADYILVGESHTNPCDHRVQTGFLQLMAENGLDAAVGLEMVPASKQPVLDRFNSRRIDVNQMHTQLEWKRIWGHDFELYKPLFQTAQQAGYGLYGLNIPPGLLDALREKGRSDLSQSESEALPDQIIPVPEEQKEDLREHFRAHEQIMDTSRKDTDLERFFLVQAIWDTQMALEARKVSRRTGKRVVILTGSGHVEHGWGIKHRLKLLDPGANVRSLLPWREEESPADSAADIFFFCPAQHRSRLGFTLEFNTRGAEIVQIQEGSRADRAGIKSGDVLLQAGGKDFEQIMDLHHAAIKARQDNKPLSLVVERRGQKHLLHLDLDRTPKSPS